jgi:hypothetical protein
MPEHVRVPGSRACGHGGYSARPVYAGPVTVRMTQQVVLRSQEGGRTNTLGILPPGMLRAVLGRAWLDGVIHWLRPR